MKKIRVLTILFLVTILFCSTVSYAGGVEDQKTLTKAKFGTIYVPDTKKVVYKCRGSSHGKTISLEKFGLDGELDYVHPMYYIAKVKSNVKAKSADSNHSSVKVKKGSEVVILYMSSHSRQSSSICRLKNKRTVSIPNSKLRVITYLYNSSSAYTDAQIEGWVKQHRITSKTKYMFVVSKFNQHGWILEKKHGEWLCKYHLALSTGAYTNVGLPNDCYGLNSLSINTHYINKRGFGRGISYASKFGGNQIHLGKAGYPFTHGCIGMPKKEYNFVYYYLPYKTRVVLF